MVTIVAGQPSWKDNKILRFAVGVTLTVLLVRWLITGDLLFAVKSAMEPPAEDGQTKSVVMFSALWPMFFEAMVIVGTAAIAWFFKLWDLLFGLINQGTRPQVAGEQVAGEQVAGGEVAGRQVVGDQVAVQQQSMSVDGLVQGLARAAATNDKATMAKLQVQIRKPYALDELSQAYTEGDVKRAEKLTTELNAMIAKANSSGDKS